jgi:hypothetical protein
MNHASVDFGLLSVCSAPHQPPLISNDEVAEWVSATPLASRASPPST